MAVGRVWDRCSWYGNGKLGNKILGRSLVGDAALFMTSDSTYTNISKIGVMDLSSMNSRQALNKR